MNGPTKRGCAEGNARCTRKSPRSIERGTITCSIASLARASPRAGSLPGKKLMVVHYSFFAIEPQTDVTGRPILSWLEALLCGRAEEQPTAGIPRYPNNVRGTDLTFFALHFGRTRSVRFSRTSSRHAAMSQMGFGVSDRGRSMTSQVYSRLKSNCCVSCTATKFGETPTCCPVCLS